LTIWNTISFSISNPMGGHPIILHELKINRPFSRGSTFTNFVDLLIKFIAFFRISRFLSLLWVLSFIVWLKDLCEGKEAIFSQNNLTIISWYLLSYVFRPSSGSKLQWRIIHVSHWLKFWYYLRWDINFYAIRYIDICVCVFLCVCVCVCVFVCVCVILYMIYIMSRKLLGRG